MSELGSGGKTTVLPNTTQRGKAAAKDILLPVLVYMRKGRIFCSYEYLHYTLRTLPIRDRIFFPVARTFTVVVYN